MENNNKITIFVFKCFQLELNFAFSNFVSILGTGKIEWGLVYRSPLYIYIYIYI